MKRYYLEGLLQRYKPFKVIVISSLFFAIFHGNIVQFVNTFLLGLMLGFSYYKTNSLWASIFMHFMNNLVAVIVAYFLKSFDFDGFSLVRLTIGCVILVISYFILRRISSKKDSTGRYIS